MDLGLSGKVALVVGGAGYIGQAVVARMTAEGCTVVSGSRSGGDVTIDGASAESVDAAVAQVVGAHGRVDVLVVAAAPSARTFDADQLSDPDTVVEAVAGKAATFLRLANAVLPGMAQAGSGRVVAISGQNAYLTGNIVGAVRNAALIVAAKSLADDHAGTGVTVNIVNPGPVVDSPGTDVGAEIGPGKPGESSPEQIAALVAFLASDLGGAVSGESISTGHKVRGIATT